MPSGATRLSQQERSKQQDGRLIDVVRPEGSLEALFRLGGRKDYARMAMTLVGCSRDKQVC